MIGDVLKKMRTIYDYKASDMSDLLGISNSYLSEIENNKKPPSLDLLKKYANVFEIKLSALIVLSENLEEDKENRSKKFARKMMIQWIEYMSKRVVDTEDRTMERKTEI